MPQLKSFLQSSQDPTQLAAKVEGAILFSSSVITYLALHLFNISIQPSDLTAFAAGAGIVAGAIWTIFGCLRNLVIWYGTVTTTPTTNPGQ